MVWFLAWRRGLFSSIFVWSTWYNWCGLWYFKLYEGLAMDSLHSKSWTKLQIEEIAAAVVKGHLVSCGTFQNFIIKSVSNRIVVLEIASKKYYHQVQQKISNSSYFMIFKSYLTWEQSEYRKMWIYCHLQLTKICKKECSQEV